VRPGGRTSSRGGWIIAEERASLTIWSFTPAGHPAHPSMVRRQVADEGGHVGLKMSVSCPAAKAACDGLVREFDVLNDQMTRALRGAR